MIVIEYILYRKGKHYPFGIQHKFVLLLLTFRTKYSNTLVHDNLILLDKLNRTEHKEFVLTLTTRTC